jgi:protein AroM
MERPGDAHAIQETTVAKTLAMVTIGQAPRTDMVPEIVAWLRQPVRIEEFGSLDGLTAKAVAGLAPRTGEHRLVTRLTDGSEAIVGKMQTHERLQKLFTRLDGQGYDLIVLLCTGHFPAFQVRTPFLEAQLAVDNMVQALTYGQQTLGVLVPNKLQIAEFHGIEGKPVKAACVSPYSGGAFAEAGRSLAATDLIVMHCMGYTEAMRQAVKEGSGRPVLLARRLLAAAIDLRLED